MRFGSFKAQLAKFGKETLVDIDYLRKAVSLKLFSAIIMDTPVDTGRARANWRTSIGLPDEHADESTDFNQALADVETTVGISRLPDALWLTNSLPYISRLEYDGWSRQAPQGMVRINVMRFQRLVDQQLRKGGRR